MKTRIFDHISDNTGQGLSIINANKSSNLIVLNLKI